MVGIVRIYQDSYGNNMGARTFCQLSRYFGGVLITDNKKIKELPFKQITHDEAILNIKKFTKIIVYNTKPNMFGGEAPKYAEKVVRLINAVQDVFYYNCDPILDLPKSVPASHEKNVPGLTRAIAKLNNFGTILSRKNCDLTKFLTAQIEQPIIKLKEGPKKQWSACYFGDSRGEERQKQVKELLMPFKNRLIIGHEHEIFPWFDYTKDFYKFLSTAWTSPVIGDKKLHYETGIPSIRLYEIWHTTTVALIDSRFQVEGLSEAFFFSSPAEYAKRTREIMKSKKLYEAMITQQQQLLKKIKKKFKNAKFNWKEVAKNKSAKMKERQQMIKELQDSKKNSARLRLEQLGLRKPKKQKKNVQLDSTQRSASV